MVEKLTTIKVTLADGFYILILPEDDGYRYYHMCHKSYGPIMCMFGVHEDSDDEYVEIALANADQYIEFYKEDYFDEF